MSECPNGDAHAVSCACLRVFLFFKKKRNNHEHLNVQQAWVRVTTHVPPPNKRSVLKLLSEIRSCGHCRSRPSTKAHISSSKLAPGSTGGRAAPARWGRWKWPKVAPASPGDALALLGRQQSFKVTHFQSTTRRTHSASILHDGAQNACSPFSCKREADNSVGFIVLLVPFFLMFSFFCPEDKHARTDKH